MKAPNRAAWRVLPGSVSGHYRYGADGHLHLVALVSHEGAAKELCTALESSLKERIAEQQSMDMPDPNQLALFEPLDAQALARGLAKIPERDLGQTYLAINTKAS